MIRKAAIITAICLLGAWAQADTINGRGIEAFQPGAMRLVPAAAAPSASLCTAARNGTLAAGDDGRTLYLCDETGSWNPVVSGGGAGVPGISASGTTGTTWTVNTDADAGTAESPAGWIVEAGDGVSLHTVTGYLTSATDLFTFTYSGGTFAFSQAVEFAAGLTVGGVSLAGTGGAALVGFNPAGLTYIGGDTAQTALSDVDLQIGNVDTKADGAQADIDAHEALATGAHAATAISYDDTASELGAATVQAGIDTLSTLGAAVSAALTAHVDDADDAHDASAISYVDVGGALGATDAQGAIDAVKTLGGSLQDAFDAHVAAVADAHDASAISIVGGAFVSLSVLIDDVQEFAGAVDAALDALNTAVAAAQSDATQALADAAAAQATADAAAPSAALADATAPDEGALLVGSSDTGTGYGDGATVEARLDDLAGDVGTVAGAASTAQGDATLALARTPSLHHLLPLVVTPVSGTPSCTSPYRDSATGAVVVRCTGAADGDSARVGACVWAAGDTAWDDGSGFYYQLSDGTGNNNVKVQVFDGDDTGTACYNADTGGTATSWTQRTVSAAALSGASCAVAGWTCIEALIVLDTADTVDIGLLTLSVQ